VKRASLKVVVIEPQGSGRVEVLKPESDGSFLKELQRCVGGYIEGLNLGDFASGYANEEGLLDGLPFNHVGTALVNFIARAEGLTGPDGVPLYDGLVGPIVLLGPVDEDGNETDVPDLIVGEARVRCASFQE
jgi:hypothetical protein